MNELLIEDMKNNMKLKIILEHMWLESSELRARAKPLYRAPYYDNTWNKGITNPLKYKVPHPNKIELEQLVWSKPTSQIAKELGVSDNAIGKWCKNYGIIKPTRGYWAKKNKAQIVLINECVCCKLSFNAKNMNAKYCSSKCREKAIWQRRKIKKKSGAQPRS